MDEATLRFFERLPNGIRSACGWDDQRTRKVISVINDALEVYLPLLRYYSIPDGGYELRIGGVREEE